MTESAVPPHVSWDGFVGLSPDGAIPSTPETGKLIAHFERQFSSVFVYADGRVIWSRPGNFGTPDLFERDLTPEGVDLVRSGSRLSALPSGELGNEIKPYVPSRYKLCYMGIRALVDPSRALDQLPTQVNDLIRGKERTDRCSEVTAEEARALELILIDMGWLGFVTPEWMNLYGDNLGSKVRFGMTVQGLLPHELGTSAVPDVVKQGTCSDNARWRLEVTDLGDMIKVRFEVHQSPVRHPWRIHFRPFSTFLVKEFFHGTSVASDSGVVVVQPRYPDRGEEGLKATVVDRQTGQVCKASASSG